MKFDWVRLPVCQYGYQAALLDVGSHYRLSEERYTRAGECKLMI